MGSGIWKDSLVGKLPRSLPNAVNRGRAIIDEHSVKRSCGRWSSHSGPTTISNKFGISLWRFSTRWVSTVVGSRIFAIASRRAASNTGVTHKVVQRQLGTRCAHDARDLRHGCRRAEKAVEKVAEILDVMAEIANRR